MTTKLRHPQAASLGLFKAKSGGSGERSDCGSGGCGGKKSAVQMLQETKAFYVKSETVLDKKQEFKPGRGIAHGTFFHSGNQKNSDLQNKLRMLLDMDAVECRSVRKSGSKEDFRGRSFEQNSCLQHKSLPDLHLSQSSSSIESSDSSYNVRYDADSRSAYSSVTQPPEATGPAAAAVFDCLPGEWIRQTQAQARLYASFRLAKSGEFVESTAGEIRSFRGHRRRRSTVSSCNRSRHDSSSKYSQSADSGRRSQGGSAGLRTGRSGLPELPPTSSPPFAHLSAAETPGTDSGTEDDFLSKNDETSSAAKTIEAGRDSDRKRPGIHRSKSDVSHKYLSNGKISSPSLHHRPSCQTTEKLETFFDHLGMDPHEYKDLASNVSGNSSPVYLTSMSSMESCADGVGGWDATEPCKQADHPSIVERNARIIKWLFNCQKFQKSVPDDGRRALACAED